MPLPMKTLREASVELGMPESEIRALVDMNKVRAVLKKGVLTFAPDELAKLKRQRRTLPESATKSSAAETAAISQPASPAKPAPPKRVQPPQPPKRPQPPRKFGE